MDSFQQVVPVDKVVTLSGFNLDAYVRFLAERQEREDQATPAPAATMSERPIASSPWLAVAALVAARLLR